MLLFSLRPTPCAFFIISPVHIKFNFVSPKNGISTFTAPGPLCPKGNRKFETLFVKIFSLNQKTNKIIQATTEKI